MRQKPFPTPLIASISALIIAARPLDAFPARLAISSVHALAHDEGRWRPYIPCRRIRVRRRPKQDRSEYFTNKYVLTFDVDSQNLNISRISIWLFDCYLTCI